MVDKKTVGILIASKGKKGDVILRPAKYNHTMNRWEAKGKVIFPPRDSQIKMGKLYFTKYKEMDRYGIALELAEVEQQYMLGFDAIFVIPSERDMEVMKRKEFIKWAEKKAEIIKKFMNELHVVSEKYAFGEITKAEWKQRVKELAEECNRELQSLPSTIELIKARRIVVDTTTGECKVQEGTIEKRTIPKIEPPENTPVREPLRAPYYLAKVTEEWKEYDQKLKEIATEEISAGVRIGATWTTKEYFGIHRKTGIRGYIYYCDHCEVAVRAGESNNNIIITDNDEVINFIVKELGCPVPPIRVAIHYEASGHCEWEPEFCHIAALLEDGISIYYGTTYDEGDQYNFDLVYKACWDGYFEYAGYTADVGANGFEVFKKAMKALKFAEKIKNISDFFEHILRSNGFIF